MCLFVWYFLSHAFFLDAESRSNLNEWGRIRRWCAGSQMTVREALNSAIDEEMERDDRVFVMGASFRAWCSNSPADVGWVRQWEHIVC